MTTAQIEWWEGMAGREAEKREQRCGESLFAEDYGKACGSFDWFDFKFQQANPDSEEDEEYGMRTEKLLKLIGRKENQIPVS